MADYIAYTDGSCHNFHPLKPGGSAYIIFDGQGKEIKRKSKGFIRTSNNRMENLAIISVVNSLPANSSVIIHSDSKYSINVLSGKWSAYENLKQVELYRRLVAKKKINVTFKWIKGHTGIEWNELCDQMAKREYEKILESYRKSIQKSKEKKSRRKKYEN